MKDIGSGTRPGPVNGGLAIRDTGSVPLKLDDSGLGPFSPDALRNGRHLGLSQFFSLAFTVFHQIQDTSTLRYIILCTPRFF